MKKRVISAFTALSLCLSPTALRVYAAETDLAAMSSEFTALEYDVLESAALKDPVIRIGEETAVEFTWAGNCERKPYVDIESSDVGVAYISKKDVITGSRYGKTAITVRAGSVSFELELTVLPPAGGTVGDSITWSFDEEKGLLTISGEGELAYEENNAPWYDWRKETMDVVIGEGITNIPEGSFNLFTKVGTFSLPSTVTDIDFDNLSVFRCEEIVVSPDNPCFSSEDGVLFSKDKTVLLKYPSISERTSYNVPDTVTEIINFGFMFCQNIQSVVIPDSVTVIGTNFYGATALEEITMSENLTKIDGMSFIKTPWLTSQLEIDPLVIIGGFVLNGKSCEGDVTIPEGIKGIADLAFSGNDTLTGVTFPEGLTDTGYLSFDSCTSLKRIEFSDTIEKIGFASFMSSGVEEVVIPETVKEIDAGAFADCEELRAVTILNKDCAIFDYNDTISNISRTSLNTGVTTVEYTGKIKGYAGSTAQAYAEKYGYEFEALPPAETITGDLNGDGEFGIADLVAMQNWILGAEKLDNAMIEAADLCKDGVLDAFDLCLMRKMLVEAMKNDSAEK